jgi:competence protein ComEA
MKYILELGRHKLILLAAVCIVAGLTIVGITLRQEPATDASEDAFVVANAPPDAFAAESLPEPTVPPPAPTDIPTIVYISGAVKQPEVYVLSSDARIRDLIEAAGGFADDADPERINLAQRLSDGQHIHVPRQGETTPTEEGNTLGTHSATMNAEGLININSADAAELEELPGIGQSIAQRIIEYRTANGPFKSVEDLQNVKGISSSVFAEIAPRITVGP